MKREYTEIWLEMTNAEIAEKLDILHLERGVAYNTFIIQAITEKLKRDGYLKAGAKPHQTKRKEVSNAEKLRDSLIRISMHKPG